VVGLFLKYVGFEIDITGEKWLQIFLVLSNDPVDISLRNTKDVRL
jgi:hypothetical protein